MLDPLGAVSVNATLPSSFLASLSSNVNITTLSATPIYLLALIFLATSYPALAPAFPKTRQRAWILTTIAAAVMTFASLPFVLDYVKRSGVRGVLPRTDVAIAVNRFFQAYLTADLAVGLLFYRAQVGFLTGWVHHVVYIGIVEVAVRGGWARVFCLAGVMELPTLLLGLSTLFPALRSNVLFALTFFATRICFHLLLIWDCFMRDHSSYADVTPPRYAATPTPYSPSYTTPTPALNMRVPALIMLAVFPLHAMWFKGCVAGFVRRYRVGHSSSAVGLDGKSGVETEKKRHPLAPDVHPDARSLAHHARVSPPPSSFTVLPTGAGEWGLRRLRALSSALLERGSMGQRWLGGPAGWVGTGGEDGGRWGVRNAILERLRQVRLRQQQLRRPGMARRMSAGLIAALPGKEVVNRGREELRKGKEALVEYVRGLA